MKIDIERKDVYNVLAYLESIIPIDVNEMIVYNKTIDIIKNYQNQDNMDIGEIDIATIQHIINTAVNTVLENNMKLTENNFENEFLPLFSEYVDTFKIQ